MWNFEKLKKKEAERGLLRFRLVFLVVLVAALLAVGGCNLTSKLQEMQGGTPAQPEGLPDLAAESVDILSPPPEKTEVTVYFKDNEGRFLAPATAEIDKVPGIARAALDVLLLGPAQGVDQVASVPAGVQARGVNVKSDGTCVVDITGLAAGNELTAKEEALVVYAVVNTLTEFENVKRVQILVDGQQKQTLAGHIPIDEPLLRNLTFVKE